MNSVGLPATPLGVWLRGKGRDVVDHPRLVLVHTPHVAAGAAVVPEVRVRILSYVRQIDGLSPRTCRTRRNRHLGKDPALMLGADTTAPIFNGEEIRARHTTQVHKVAGKGYRFDVGGLAFWAGCDRATTLVAGARHGGPHRFAARNVPAEPQTIRAKLRASGRVVRPKSWEAIPFVSLGGLPRSRLGNRGLNL